MECSRLNDRRRSGLSTAKRITEHGHVNADLAYYTNTISLTPTRPSRHAHAHLSAVASRHTNIRTIDKYLAWLDEGTSNAL